MEFALDPYKYESENSIIDMRLEKISGIYYDIETIIVSLNRSGKPIISIFFNPELMDPNKANDLDHKIKALEKHLNAVGNGRWPIRVVIDFLDRKHEDIHFNIYEYSQIKKGVNFICRSLHGIYKITRGCFIYVDGKILGITRRNINHINLFF